MVKRTRVILERAKDDLVALVREIEENRDSSIADVLEQERAFEITRILEGVIGLLVTPK
jgi:hypothetical protein